MQSWNVHDVRLDLSAIPQFVGTSNISRASMPNATAQEYYYYMKLWGYEAVPQLTVRATW